MNKLKIEEFRVEVCLLYVQEIAAKARDRSIKFPVGHPRFLAEADIRSATLLKPKYKRYEGDKIGVT